MDGVVHAYISNDVFDVARTVTHPACTSDSIPEETGPGATEIEMTVASGAYTFGNEGECPLASSAVLIHGDAAKAIRNSHSDTST
ncbi:MAG TPA: hypothetical protein VKD22_11215 [Ramlibacter sp.]|nr:hypothetical protein [Ramlibacter sp.]